MSATKPLIRRRLTGAVSEIVPVVNEQARVLGDFHVRLTVLETARTEWQAQSFWNRALWLLRGAS